MKEKREGKAKRKGSRRKHRDRRKKGRRKKFKSKSQRDNKKLKSKLEKERRKNRFRRIIQMGLSHHRKNLPLKVTIEEIMIGILMNQGEEETEAKTQFKLLRKNLSLIWIK
jgi:hypothetical protein